MSCTGLCCCPLLVILGDHESRLCFSCYLYYIAWLGISMDQYAWVCTTPITWFSIHTWYSMHYQHYFQSSHIYYHNPCSSSQYYIEEWFTREELHQALRPDLTHVVWQVVFINYRGCYLGSSVKALSQVSRNIHRLCSRHLEDSFVFRYIV